MPTTVHIPGPLLAALDKRAAELGVSRNRLIVQAVERALQEQTGWPPGFFERFTNVDPTNVEAVDEMLLGILEHRRSKRPPSL